MLRQAYRAVGLTCICLYGSVTSVCAQHKLDSLQRLDEVVVTGKNRMKEVIPVQQLSGEQL